MSYWLFQANPQYSRVMTAISELNEIYWLVTRYTTEIAPGDGVLVWVAGEQAGIYAIAHVTQSPHYLEHPPDLKYWITPARASYRVYAPIQFEQKWVENPLLKAQLRHDPILNCLQVIHAPHNTNFRVTQEQWERVGMLRGKMKLQFSD